jgi:hypothetical protein
VMRGVRRYALCEVMTGEIFPHADFLLCAMCLTILRGGLSPSNTRADDSAPRLRESWYLQRHPRPPRAAPTPPVRALVMIQTRPSFSRCCAPGAMTATFQAPLRPEWVVVMRKGQVKRLGRVDAVGQVKFIETPFGVVV